MSPGPLRGPMSSFPALTLPYRTNGRTGDCTSLNTHAPLPSEYLHKLVPLSRLPSPHTHINPTEPLFVSQRPAEMLLPLPCPYVASLSLTPERALIFLLGSKLSIRLRVLIPTRLWATEEAVSFQLCFPALRTRPSQGKTSDKYLPGGMRQGS